MLPRAPAGAGRLALALGTVVLLAAALSFLPALLQGFVLGDDDYNLALNPRWRGLSAEHLGWMWSTFFLGHWQPLTWMSFGLEHELWGRVDPQRMHALNLILHALAALLVSFVFGRLLNAAWGAGASERPREILWAAALGALVWAVHPLRVESVVWATERRDLLSGLFLIAAVLSWLRWLAGEGRGWWAATLVLYTLSLLSKAWGMTLPVLLLGIDVYPLRRLASAGGGLRGLGRLALEKAPFVPLALGTAVLAAAAQASEGATVPLADHGLVARTAQAAYGLLFYPWKTLLPTGLSTLYLLEDGLDPTRLVYLASLTGVVAITLALWVARRRFPAGLAAWAAYALLVSPVLGILQSGQQKVADRYGYLALLPLCLLAAGGLFALLRAARTRRVAIAASLVVLGVLGASSWRQTLQWRDSLTLWTRAARLEPDNYIAQLNVAAALRELGRREEARQRAQLSIAANPGPENVYARFYVGLLRMEEGDFEAALVAWREALAVDPADLTTLQVASGELSSRGRAQEAVALLESGVAAAPGDLQLRALLAEALWGSGDRARAEQVWRAGLDRAPRWADGHAGLARALLARGGAAEAEQHLRVALGQDPEHAEALLLLGRVLRARGLVQDAEALWRRVPTRDPRHAEAQALLRQSRGVEPPGR